MFANDENIDISYYFFLLVSIRFISSLFVSFAVDSDVIYHWMQEICQNGKGEIHSQLEQLYIKPVDSRTNSQRHPFFEHFAVYAFNWEKPKKIPFEKIDRVIAKKEQKKKLPSNRNAFNQSHLVQK